MVHQAVDYCPRRFTVSNGACVLVEAIHRGCALVRLRVSHIHNQGQLKCCCSGQLPAEEKRLGRQRKIIEEIVKTEKDYVAKLLAIAKGYVSVSLS